MKTKKTYLIFFAIGALLSLAMECKKENLLDEDGLPRATQTGANNFGFLLNGEPWYPKGMAGLSPNFVHNVNLNDDNGRFRVRGSMITETEDPYFSIGIIRDLNKYTVPFSLPIVNDGNIWFYFSGKGCTVRVADEDVHVSGELVVTKLDRVAGIIAGTFNMSLVKEGCDINITKGRFDLKFNGH